MTRLSREEAEALLVFYANGSLDDVERGLVSDALETDVELQRELRMVLEMRSEMQASAPVSPGETAFYRLMKDVDRVPQDPTVIAIRQRGKRVSVLQAVLALAVVAMLAQGVILWQGLTGGFDLAAGSSRADLIVAFHPDAQESDIRTLLLDLDLQIVAGPSSLGLYRLTSDDPAAAIQVLQTQVNVVESAENANE